MERKSEGRLRKAGRVDYFFAPAMTSSMPPFM